MKERIREIMDSKGMTQQDFSQFLEMSPASLSSILTGRTNPTLNIVESIKKKMSKINIEWLMFGTGDMYLTDKLDSDCENEACLSDGTNENSTITNPIITTSDFPKNTDSLQNHSSKNTMRDTLRSSSEVMSGQSMVDMKIFNKNVRKIKEIRVFYDDQTYESFVPKD